MTQEEYNLLIPVWCTFHGRQAPDVCWGITSMNGPFRGQSPEDYCKHCEFNKNATEIYEIVDCGVVLVPRRKD